MKYIIKFFNTKNLLYLFFISIMIVSFLINNKYINPYNIIEGNVNCDSSAKCGEDDKIYTSDGKYDITSNIDNCTHSYNKMPHSGKSYVCPSKTPVCIEGKCYVDYNKPGSKKCFESDFISTQEHNKQLNNVDPGKLNKLTQDDGELKKLGDIEIGDHSTENLFYAKNTKLGAEVVKPTALKNAYDKCKNVWDKCRTYANKYKIIHNNCTIDPGSITGRSNCDWGVTATVCRKKQAGGDNKLAKGRGLYASTNKPTEIRGCIPPISVYRRAGPSTRTGGAGAWRGAGN